VANLGSGMSARCTVGLDIATKCAAVAVLFASVNQQPVQRLQRVAGHQFDSCKQRFGKCRDLCLTSFQVVSEVGFCVC